MHHLHIQQDPIVVLQHAIQENILKRAWFAISLNSTYGLRVSLDLLQHDGIWKCCFASVSKRSPISHTLSVSKICGVTCPSRQLIRCISPDILRSMAHILGYVSIPVCVCACRSIKYRHTPIPSHPIPYQIPYLTHRSPASQRLSR